MAKRQSDTTAGRRPGSTEGRAGRHTRVRFAAGGVVVLAAAALLAGCGDKDKDADASAPQKVNGTAAPAGDNGGHDTSPNGGSSDSGDTDQKSSPGEGASGQEKASSDSSSSSSSSSSSEASTRHGGNGAAAGTACHTSDLKATVGDNHPGAGQENFALVLTNTSAHGCTVRGYPGLAFVNNNGEQVTVDPERTSGSKDTISLAPGHSAWASLSFTNPGVTNVTTVDPAAVTITPPDETSSLKVTWSGGPVSNTGKASVPKVSTFRAGSGE